MQMNKYILLKKGLGSIGQLIKPEELDKSIKDRKSDYYASVYYYNEIHKKQFDEKKSIAGIKDVKTDKLIFDFDSASNIELARKDAATLLERLQKLGLKEETIEIYFSGNKGFNVIVNLNKEITPEQARKLAIDKYGKGLETLDTTLYDAAQILRVPLTKHQKTPYYKIPLTYDDLKDLHIEDIKDGAQNPQLIQPMSYTKANLDESFYEIEIVKKELTSVSNETKLDLKTRPKGWKSYKWALAQGYFESGERHEAMMILAATCRGLNYDKITTYYLCKAALDKHMQRTGRDEKFPKEELWENIIEKSIFSSNWKGGQYTPDNNALLAKICDRLGIKRQERGLISSISDVFGMFEDYAENIDNLTIKTGIEPLDKKVRMTVGMSVGIIAPPAVGKTSVALQMLNNMSKADHQSVFFSYDMYHAMVLQKLAQKHTNMHPDEIFKKFQNNDTAFKSKLQATIKDQYKNVDFCFNSGQNVQDILDTIEESEQRSGKKVKFVAMDYNELVVTDYSDPTQSSSFVAQKLREYANDKQMCVLSLFQPNKMSSHPSEEITTYNSAKGSSAIAQSVSIMMGLSRPGFNPKTPEKDRFMTINCLKNRVGPLFSIDLKWDGLTGSVRELTSEEMCDLEDLRQTKNEEKTVNDEWK